MRDSKDSKGSKKAVDFNLEQPRGGPAESAKEEVKEASPQPDVMKKLDPEKAKKDLLDAHGK